MKDLTGQRFGRLVALEKVKGSKWLCQCDCGKRSTPTAVYLRRGAIVSCGCYNLDRIKARSVRAHASGSRHPLYPTWRHMVRRCTYEKHPNFRDYGGRGITVCERWLHSFENFLADMGDRPPGHSIDRIDNNGNYEPSNCRWATKAEQTRNTRRVKISKEIAEAIRERVRAGVRNQVIAAEFGVRPNLVSRIRGGYLWR